MHSVLPAVSQALASASGQHHRQLFILSGSESACLVQAQHLLVHPALSANPVWLGAGAPGGVSTVTAAAVTTLLGGELSAAVINTFSGFECDAAAALEGTITAGGALILLIPETDKWARCTDPAQKRMSAYPAGFAWPERKPQGDIPASSPFINRFTDLLNANSVRIATFPGGSIRSLISPEPAAPGTSTTVRQSAQQRVIHALEQHPFQHKCHSLLLTADRGRGKSAALGIAAARLIVNHGLRILVSAPGKRAVKVLFQHWQDECAQHGQLDAHASSNTDLQFCPPDQLARMASATDLLIIDEAASIPLPLLVDAASIFPHTIFATTTSGYEGAGRGFALRLTHLLSQRRRRYQQLTLDYPFRWAPGDPLEAFCHQAFLLDAPLHAVNLPLRNKLRTSRATPVLSSVNTTTLANDETRLRIIFGLLLQAHYKTTPNDLRHLLDSQNLRCYTLELEGQTIGAAMIASEGPLTGLALRQGILHKRRRPAGHLLPQLLAQYTGCAAALDLQLARVVRIAIHPQYQRRGFGSDMLHGLSSQLQQEGFDAIGAMFSAIPGTVRFWQRKGYISCHLGARKQTSGGYRSMTMLQPLSAKADSITQLAHILYSDTRSFHGTGPRNSAAPDHPMAALYDTFVLQRYINGERTFMDSHAALARMAAAVIEKQRSSDWFSSADYRLLSELRSAQATVGELAASQGLASKKVCETRLRQIARAEYWPLAQQNISGNPARQT